MISQIGLRNVRLFGNIGYSFNLPALTIFCGTNSSGKSTILKSLLLLRQSQGLHETYSTRPGILRLTGSQVDLGNYQSFVTDKDSNRNIEISLGIKDVIPNSLAEDLAKSKDMQLKLKGRRGYIDYDLYTSFQFRAFKKATETDEAGRIIAVAPRGVLHNATFKLVVNEQLLASWSIARSISTKDEFYYTLHLPISELSGFATSSLKLQQNKPNKGKELTFMTELDGLLPRYIFYKDRSAFRVKTERMKFPLPTHIGGAVTDLIRALLRIHYLAPLRTAGKRYYLANYDVAADLDPSGDFLPYILGGIIEEPKVIHVLPKMKSVVRHELSRALQIWLYYLRTGTTSYSTSKRSEFGVSTSKGTLVEIDLKGIKGALKHSIADSGFGYSQVLPILVRGLIAPKGSTLVVEQPELHLNPAIQVRLVDFFIALVNAGKQVIVETHSEHIVNAVRVCTAKETGYFLANNAKIYFLDIDRGMPTVHDMNIKPDGTVPGWPFHFFGEAASLTGELLRAQKKQK